MDREKIRNLYFVGRNYVKHARELNNKIPEEPLIFTKPLSTISEDGNVKYPPHTKELHYEGEMVFMLTNNGKYLAGCGIDYTARDVQRDEIRKGNPWFLSKCFGTSTVISKDFFELRENDLKFLEIKTFVNGVLKQEGKYSEKLFGILDILNYLNNFFNITENDIIFTGTPAGVGSVKVGDVVEVILYFKDRKISLQSKVL